MENRKTKKPNDPLLCRKKESNRGFEVPKKPDNVFEKKNYFLESGSNFVLMEILKNGILINDFDGASTIFKVSRYCS